MMPGWLTSSNHGCRGHAWRHKAPPWVHGTGLPLHPCCCHSGRGSLELDQRREQPLPGLFLLFPRNLIFWECRGGWTRVWSSVMLQMARGTCLEKVSCCSVKSIHLVSFSQKNKKNNTKSRKACYFHLRWNKFDFSGLFLFQTPYTHPRLQLEWKPPILQGSAYLSLSAGSISNSPIRSHPASWQSSPGRHWKSPKKIPHIQRQMRAAMRW